MLIRINQLACNECCDVEAAEKTNNMRTNDVGKFKPDAMCKRHSMYMSFYILYVKIYFHIHLGSRIWCMAEICSNQQVSYENNAPRCLE